MTWGQDHARIAAPWLTHRCEDPPAACRHEAPHRVRPRGDCLSPIASGNGSRYHEAGSGARDPGMASPSAYPWPPTPSLSGWALRPGEVPARDTRNTAWHHVAW
jgi:hypothetical protein